MLCISMCIYVYSYMYMCTSAYVHKLLHWSAYSFNEAHVLFCFFFEYIMDYIEEYRYNFVQIFRRDHLAIFIQKKKLTFLRWMWNHLIPRSLSVYSKTVIKIKQVEIFKMHKIFSKLQWRSMNSLHYNIFHWTTVFYLFIRVYYILHAVLNHIIQTLI